MELININSIRITAEKKLRQQAARQNRDLRLILGHFEILDQINGCHFDKAAKHKPRPTMPGATTRPFGNEAPREQEQPPAALHIEEVAIVDDDDDNTIPATPHHQVISSPNTLSWPHEKTFPEVACVELEEGSSSDEESISDDEDGDKDMYFDAPEAGVDVPHHSPPSFVDDSVDKAAQYLYTAFQESVHEVGDDD